jgi:hypothetical protein
MRGPRFDAPSAAATSAKSPDPRRPAARVLPPQSTNCRCRDAAPPAAHPEPSFPPVIVRRHEFPRHRWRKVPQHRLVRRMDVQERRYQQQQRIVTRPLDAQEIPLPCQLPRPMQLAHPRPVIQRLQGQMRIVIRLQAQPRQPPLTRPRQQIEQRAAGRRECRNLRVLRTSARRRSRHRQVLPQPQLQPASAPALADISSAPCLASQASGNPDRAPASAPAAWPSQSGASPAAASRTTA